MAERICTVIVTHNRADLLAHCLRALSAQERRPDAVLVVDNASSDGTSELLAHQTGIEVLRLDANLGGAGGFAAGMSWARDRGFDWAWIMDDDALPREDALAELEPHMSGNSDQIVAFASQLVPPGKSAPAPDTEVRPIPKALFVGFAVSRAVLRQVGLPRQDFFIYSDDSEYCIRIRRAGGLIRLVPSSVIMHADWLSAPQNVVVRAAGRKLVIYPSVPGWKAYYLARNRLLIGRHHGLRQFVRGLAQSTLFLLLTILLRPRNLLPVAMGIKHGLMGRSGKVLGPG